MIIDRTPYPSARGTAPARPPPEADIPELTRMQRRRVNFFRAERLSQSEISYFAPDFDPGPEYD